jgi:hypothetical protein
MQNPTQDLDNYWIQDRVNNDYPDHTERGGKWLIFLKTELLDEYWNKIRQSLHDSGLGSIAKTATSKPNPNAASSKEKVICVYSYDADDKEDVMRIRQSLRDIGITWKIPYKLDHATLLGRYRKKGDKRISAYYE